MDNGDSCPTCGEPVTLGTTPCPACGSSLAGARPVALEATREEALLAFRLLESSGMRPTLAYLDETGVPHPVDADEPFTQGAGLILPVTTVFAVYAPESEVGDAKQILEDARKALPESDA